MNEFVNIIHICWFAKQYFWISHPDRLLMSRAEGVSGECRTGTIEEIETAVSLFIFVRSHDGAILFYVRLHLGVQLPDVRRWLPWGYCWHVFCKIQVLPLVEQHVWWGPHHILFLHLLGTTTIRLSLRVSQPMKRGSKATDDDDIPCMHCHWKGTKFQWGLGHMWYSGQPDDSQCDTATKYPSLSTIEKSDAKNEGHFYHFVFTSFLSTWLLHHCNILFYLLFIEKGAQKAHVH